MIIYVFDRVENIAGKEENAGYQHFLLFPQCFEKASFQDTSKGVIVWEWVKDFTYVSIKGIEKSDIDSKTIHIFNAEIVVWIQIRRALGQSYTKPTLSNVSI